MERRSVANRLAWDRIAGVVLAVTDELIDLGVVNDTAGINSVGNESVSLSAAGFPRRTRLVVFRTSESDGLQLILSDFPYLRRPYGRIILRQELGPGFAAQTRIFYARSLR